MTVAVLDDVTTDLARARTFPDQLQINAYASFRDVDVIVAKGTHAELFGSMLRGKLAKHAPLVPVGHRRSTVRVHGQALIGDVIGSVQAKGLGPATGCAE